MIERIEMIVMGASSGASTALRAVLAPLPSDFDIPIVIVRHQPPDANDYIIRHLENTCSLPIRFAEEAQYPVGGRIYLAPPGRHVQITPTGCFELLATPEVNFCRPSVDVLFASAATYFGPHLAGVVLTGANADGAAGLKTIKQRGGLTIVQNPKSAEAAAMPKAAIASTPVDYIIWLDQIGPFLWDIQQKALTINIGKG